ncbi:MAG: serine--tRNA ligase, partial [Candidatus Gracilibacteria bacterium]|nr:serine--tRNA ligase [Candidatus Gracilibacteria bacterium]
MLDIKIIRENPEKVQDIIQKRNLKLNVADFLVIDAKKRDLILQIDALRTLKNKVSKEIPTLSNEEKPAKISEMKQVGEDLKKLESEQETITQEWNTQYYKFPNLLDETAAIGNTDEDNSIEYVSGEKRSFDFPVQSHYDIGEKKGWIHIEKGSEVSGSRFWYLKGDLVLLQLALQNYAISQLVSQGFEPMLPPVLVREKAMFGTGFFPVDEDGIYQVNPGEDNLYLVGTSEVPVTSFHGGETLNLDKPKMYAGISPCFRREAGSAGKDTRGILRGHQFDKVEMVVFCKPEESQKMHNFMVEIEENIWNSLGIPFQKMNV